MLQYFVTGLKFWIVSLLSSLVMLLLFFLWTALAAVKMDLMISLAALIMLLLLSFVVYGFIANKIWGWD